MKNDTLSDESLNLLNFLPFLICIGVIMFFGIISNLLIIFFYPFNKNFSADNYSIKLLAYCDIVTCILSCPIFVVLELGLIRTVGLCKISGFLQNYISTFTA